eukprot:985632-Karenia_brevis.AAC.1
MSASLNCNLYSCVSMWALALGPQGRSGGGDIPPRGMMSSPMLIMTILAQCLQRSSGSRIGVAAQLELGSKVARVLHEKEWKPCVRRGSVRGHCHHR